MLVLSPVLSLGFGPLPARGITGAGLALAAYYLVATVILAAALIRGRGGVRLSLRHLLRQALFGEILGVGLWSSLNTVLSNLCVVVATFFVARSSMEALAGFGLGIRIEFLPCSYTHLRAHATVLLRVCLLLPVPQKHHFHRHPLHAALA